MKTYIIGHLKPDTDAVVAPLALQALYQAESCFGHENAEVVTTGPLNPETTFLFEKFGMSAPRTITAADIDPEDRVVLVDHNEENQRLADLNPESIAEILDHHKINCNFKNPIFLTFKPWGSSTSIAYFLLKQYKVMPNKQLASLMLAAILSDTVGYKSATTTEQDKKFGAELAEIAGISDVAAFTLEIFKAKSDISSLTAEEIVTNDYKIFEFGKKTLIGQIETVEQAALLSDKKSELLAAMSAVKAREGVELLFLAVTDILEVNTKLLILSDDEKVVAEQAFGGSTADNVLDIGPKMSRKKEIAPAIEAALS